MTKVTARRFVTRNLGRTLFWNAVHKLEPAVAADLFTSVGPVYKALPKHAFVYPKPGSVGRTHTGEGLADDEDWIANMAFRESLAEDAPEGMRWPMSYYDLLHASPQDGGEAGALAARLSSWAGRFRLNERDIWVFDNALYSLRWWADDPTRERGAVRVLTGGTDIFAERNFRYVVDLSWDPAEQSRPEFRADVRRRVDEELNRFFRRGPAEGWTDTVIKDGEGFRWLAQYQIKAMSPNAIAKRVHNDRINVTKESVTDTIRNRARLIGLTLRESLRGPRRKSKL